MKWTKEVLYLNQDQYFSDMIKGIAQARESVEIEMYIYERGVLGDRITDALVQARTRNVSVRVLIDGIGSPAFSTTYEERLKNNGVQVKYYRTWSWFYHRVPGEPAAWTSKLYYRFARLNRGNHRKICLIDKKTLWTGSANISDVHLREVYRDKAWKDLGVCVEGKDIRIAKRALDLAFLKGVSLELKVRLPKLLVINQTFFQKPLQRAVQLKLLQSAKQRIWIQTPYFVPLPRVARRLVKKAAEGVDVRVLVPQKNDVWIIPWLSFSYFRLLSRRGVKIYEYPGEFIHQKLYIIDDWICMGSTNLNHRSFLHDLEIDVVITHENNKAQLEQSFLQDQNNSRLLDQKIWDTYGPLKKTTLWLASWLAYWA